MGQLLSLSMGAKCKHISDNACNSRIDIVNWNLIILEDKKYLRPRLYIYIYVCVCVCVKTPHNECCGYDTKQSDSEDRVMFELWGM